MELSRNTVSTYNPLQPEIAKALVMNSFTQDTQKLPSLDVLQKGGPGSGRKFSSNHVSNAILAHNKGNVKHALNASGGLHKLEGKDKSAKKEQFTLQEVSDHLATNGMHPKMIAKVTGHLNKGEDVTEGVGDGPGIEGSIKKGGEGSKGGKVIGHTKSGKPMYENLLKKFPDKPKHWGQATDELADVHNKMAEHYNEDRGEKDKYAGHQGKSKTAEEYVKKHKEGIRHLSKKLTEEQHKQVGKHFEGWFDEHKKNKVEKAFDNLLDIADQDLVEKAMNNLLK